MNHREIERLVAKGESDEAEFEKSTSQLRRAGETLCSFLNGAGGLVLIGVTSEDEVTGEALADSTPREVAALLDRFEPPAPVRVHRVPGKSSDEVIVLQAPAAYDARPFVFDRRRYQRVGIVTLVLPQERYQNLLRERAHARIRWEHDVVPDVALDELDRD